MTNGYIAKIEMKIYVLILLSWFIFDININDVAITKMKYIQNK